MGIKVDRIRICLGSSCFSRGNEENLEIIKNYLTQHHINADIDFKGHLCHEFCNRGPVLEINNTCHEEVYPENVETILNTYFKIE